MIHPDGLFTHVATLRREADGSWRGRADPCGLPRPGLVGDQPEVVVQQGTVSLTPTDDRAKYRFRISVGEALEAVLHDGDRVLLRRHGTGDVGIVISREDALILAIGAVEDDLANFRIKAAYDPRAFEVELYSMKKTLSRPDVRLLWFDPESSNIAERFDDLANMPSSVGYVVAVARSTDERTINDLNRRIFQPMRGNHALEFATAPESFVSQEQWVAYVERLPDVRPPDLFIEFTIAEATTKVVDRNQEFVDPFHLAVLRLFIPSCPGQMTLLAVARSHPALTPEMLAACTFEDTLEPMAT